MLSLKLERIKLSNFINSYQVQLKFSNFIITFQLLVFPIAFSNYTYPVEFTLRFQNWISKACGGVLAIFKLVYWSNSSWSFTKYVLAFHRAENFIRKSSRKTDQQEFYIRSHYLVKYTFFELPNDMLLIIFIVYTFNVAVIE